MTREGKVEVPTPMVPYHLQKNIITDKKINVLLVCNKQQAVSLPTINLQTGCTRLP